MNTKKLLDPFAEREAAKYDNPIPSRELISQVLESSSGPVGYKKLVKTLNISSEQKEAFRRRIRAMERDGQLIANRKGEYGLTDKMDLIRGRVQGHRDGFGFVIPVDGSEDIYVSHRQMCKVFDGDEVLVRLGKINFKGRQEGDIIEVLSRNTEQLVGRLFEQEENYFVKPENIRNSHDILISPKHTSNALSGQFVVVEIIRQPNKNQKPSGQIVEVLGDHMAPGMEIDVAIRSHGIPNSWPEEVEQYCTNFPAEVREEDKKARFDLRALPFVTIDGEDARDFDDAVYCETKKSGGWRLYVAIADVSHYVAKGSPLDDEASIRGNSVYFPDYVIPMLPHVLSNGLCSLNPHVDRLCMVCEMTVSKLGKISGFQFYEAVMHSHARLTYTQVGQLLDDKHKSSSVVRTKMGAIAGHVDELYRLYQAMRDKREERGAIEFSTKETRIVFDKDRKIKKIVPVERNDAHKLIEECMLAANVSAAKLLESLDIPSLYRVHESPNPEKLELLYQFLGGLGVTMKTGQKVTPQDYGDVLSAVTGRPDAHLIQTVMLRSMNQARYQAENLGHFGLAYPAYAHFTSPIRRYPDLIVHRAIRALIRSSIQTTKVRRDAGRKPVEFAKNYPYSVADMVNYGDLSSATERRADEATRDVISWLKCEYLQDHIGEEFDGVVSAVTAFGLFVELNTLHVEGLIHISSLPQDYYHHEPAQHTLVGERTGRVFRLADQLRVRVARVDLDERKVDFDLLGLKTAHRKSSKTSSAVKKAQVSRKVRKRPVSRVDDPVSEQAKKKSVKSKPVTEKKAKKKAIKKTKVKAKKVAAKQSKRRNKQKK